MNKSVSQGSGYIYGHGTSQTACVFFTLSQTYPWRIGIWR